MIGRLPYEPSVGAVLATCLPDARLQCDPATWRARVAGTVIVRATAPPEIYGGELLLVPANAAAHIFRQLDILSDAGVSGVIFCVDREGPGETAWRVPVAFTGSETDVRTLRDKIEAFVNRRRRELFDLGQEFHRLLVEPAILGAAEQQLLERAAHRAEAQILLDRDEVVAVTAQGKSEPDRQLVLRARVAAAGRSSGTWVIPGDPPVVGASINAGAGLRGSIAVVPAADADLDEVEMLAAALAAGCAIAVTRRPESELPDVSVLLESARNDARSWARVLVLDTVAPPARVGRAVTSAAGRLSTDFRVGVAERRVVVLVPPGTDIDSMFRDVVTRLAPNGVRAGASREHDDGDLSFALRAATAAVERARSGELVHFDTVELSVLLAAVPDFDRFMKSRLGALVTTDANASELRETLRTYLASGRSLAGSARNLNVHRNTVAYRLRRIEELLSADLDDPDTAFALDLALRFYDLHSR